MATGIMKWGCFEHLYLMDVCPWNIPRFFELLVAVLKSLKRLEDDPFFFLLGAFRPIQGRSVSFRECKLSIWGGSNLMHMYDGFEGFP